MRRRRSAFGSLVPTSLLYPLRGTALIAFVALLLCSQLRILPGVGWMLALVVWISVYVYAFQILRATADGHADAPEVLLNEDSGLAVRFALMYILLYGLLLATFVWQPVAGLVLLVILALMQPSFLIATVLNDSVIRSLDPTLTVQMLKRIGVPYLAVAVFLVLMQVGVAFAGRAVNAGVMPLLAEIIMSAISIWGIFAAFHLLGQLVHEYRDVLGHEALHDPTAPMVMATADQRMVDQALRYVEDGRSDRARELLRADVLGRAAGLPVHATYHELLSGEPWVPRHAEHYPLYIGRLLAEQQGNRALLLLREALEADPGFVPGNPQQATALADLAERTGQTGLLTDLRQAMLQAWPDDPQAPDWALRTASLVHDRTGDAGKALAILRNAERDGMDAESKRRFNVLRAAIQGTAR